ncbi:hypothetical protein ESA94_10520 [Lacibacter luteus]|uniref:Uncharacterized protein n=1 Tax=Lacibacter luteus TaxID=2508719 RepID=A0A4Q1CJW6_9BACT|nr:hypothetical protein [Lacibacter luteus]RXK60883.1 hypothetical protein ESA94_10520 [Lacibacter luteus]
MNNIRLNNTLSFSVEPYNGKLRFVVYENSKEYVCRIERKKAMETFLIADTASIFKGRLQLHKYNNEIAVEVKGEIVGNILLSSFKKMLSTS